MKAQSRTSSCCVFLLLFAILLLGISSSAEDIQSNEAAATCNNDDGNSCQEQSNKPNNNRQPLREDMPVSVTFSNRSPSRVDVYYDDGRFGKVVGSLNENGGEINISTFPNHRFFATIHGTREPLVSPDNDEQYFFTVTDKDENQVFILPTTAAPSTTLCKDRYPVCTTEAARGECTNNPGWMIVNCCKSCDDKEGYGHLIDSSIRCDPKRLNATVPAWQSNDLNKLFTSWATDAKYEQYDPVVISSPDKVHDAEYDGPWIMTFDNFLDDFEIKQLLHGASYGEGFIRSTDQGRVNPETGEMVKVTSQTRTSSNAWCRAECEALPGVKRVTDRIEEVTGIPQNNYESFQILKYNEGQFYRTHHDSSGGKKTTSAGHRILTFFLYLNDEDLEGGETRFTSLDISVKPKKRRALIWPSVLNEDPDQSDIRMYHEAMTVIKGTKYAANHWIHMYDFRNANKWGCNGSFG